VSRAQSEARERMLTQPGHLYAAFSKGECWIKLGFSLNVDRRIGEINRRFPQLAPFSLIGKTPSLYRAERQMHRILWPFREYQTGLSRELYLAVPAVQRIIKTVVTGVDRPPLDYQQVRECFDWALKQASPIRDDIRDWYRVARQTNYQELP
jgi:hypothetical protein